MSNIITESIKTYYDNKPPVNNIYYIDSFTYGGTPLKEDGKTLLKEDLKTYKYACKAIDLPVFSFEMETESFKTIRMPFIKGVNLNKTFSISWTDDINRNIMKKHIEWINSWYNYKKDTFEVGGGKFGEFNIIICGRDYKEIGSINITGVIPKKLPPYELSYDNDIQDNYQVEYSFEECAVTLNGTTINL